MAYSKQLENIAENMNTELDKLGLAPGAEIWIIRSACCKVSNSNGYHKKYLEKYQVLKVSLIVGDGMPPIYKFTDTNLNDFSMKDVGVTVFTNRNEAIENL